MTRLSTLTNGPSVVNLMVKAEPPASPQITGTMEVATIDVDGRQYQQHPVHFYDDGNSVFAVGEVLFRVYGGLLSRRSKVITNLLAESREATLNERSAREDASENSMDLSQVSLPTVDGISIVTLHGIDSKDFAAVLDIIYPATVIVPGEKTIDLATVLGVLHVAHKYQMDDILRWATAHATRLLPTKPQDTGLLPVYKDTDVAVRVINDFPKYNLPQFVPFAMYSLATLEWDGKSGLLPDGLPLDTQSRINKGRLLLQRFVIEEAMKRPENGFVSFACKRDGDANGRPMVWTSATERWTKLLLHPLEELHNRQFARPLICADCADAVKSGSLDFVKKIVAQLPTIFAVSSKPSMCFVSYSRDRWLTSENQMLGNPPGSPSFSVIFSCMSQSHNPPFCHPVHIVIRTYTSLLVQVPLIPRAAGPVHDIRRRQHRFTLGTRGTIIRLPGV